MRRVATPPRPRPTTPRATWGPLLRPPSPSSRRLASLARRPRWARAFGAALIAAMLATAHSEARSEEPASAETEELLVGFVGGVPSARAQAIYEALGASKL